jgi:hypothetical protein
MNSSSDNHRLSADEADLLALEIDSEEWSYQDRVDWAAENGTEGIPYRSKRKGKRGGGGGGDAENVSKKQRGGDGGAGGGGTDGDASGSTDLQTLVGVVSTLTTNVARMTELAAGPRVTIDRHPTPIESLQQLVPPAIRVLSDRDALLENATRLENSLRASIQGCVTYARSLHSELEVIAQVKRNIQGMV